MAEAVFLYPGDILVDDFEYENSLYNHPYGIGYATIFKTVLDLQKGSKVLDVYRPASVFLIGTPYEKHAIFYDLNTPPSAADKDGETGIDMAKNSTISFDFRAPPGIEPWDIFELDVIGVTVGGDRVTVRIVPLQPSAGACLGTPVNSAEGTYGASYVVTGFSELAGQLQVTVSVGPGLLDGSWHTVWVDVAGAVEKAITGFSDIEPNERADWYIDTALAVLVGGQMFRFDNLVLRTGQSHKLFKDPHLFEMGTQYAQISEPYRYLFIADCRGTGITVFDRNGEAEEINQITDLMLNPDNFLLVQDPNDPNDPVVRYWTDLGADPNLFGQNDPNLVRLFSVLSTFAVDLDLPIFADQNLRMTPEGPGPMAKLIIDSGTLGWNGTVMKYDPEPTTIMWDPEGPINHLITYPYDGMPTYLPAYYSAIEVVKKWGRPYYSPDSVSMLEGALWNAGVWFWPNIAYFDYPPMIGEICLTIEVTNGVQYDTGEVTIRVADFPVENYAPVFQLPDEELIFYVGEVGAHHITFIDPDCFIFSISETPQTDRIPGLPVNEDFRRDMDDLVWAVTAIDGVTITSWPDYISNASIGMNDWDYADFGYTGLLTLDPEYEGTHDMVVRCQDALGGTGIANLRIVFVSRSDRDSDYIYDYLDNCPDTMNTDQMDTDQDGLGDACDPCPHDPNSDRDGDGVCVSEGDCNDNDAAIYPGAPELCDGKDNDCNGIIPSEEVDSDADGSPACDDCNDQDNSVYPGAPGTHAGKDNNCNGVIENNEKKRYAQGSLYPGYIPVLFPWLQTLPYSNLNYQLPLTASWSPMQYTVSPQQMWYSGYPSALYASPYPQTIFPSGPFRFQFILSNWSQTYFQHWNLIQNQLP